MLKWIMYAVLALLVGGSWFAYWQKGKQLTELKEKIAQFEGNGSGEELLPKMISHSQSIEGEKTFTGVLLTFLSAGVFGIFFAVYVLPFIVNRLTHAVFDSGEMIEKDPMRDARSLSAQGDFEGAIEAFRSVAATDPLNRLPWVEIVNLQKNHLADPAAAIQTIRHALESQEWQLDDAAYFLFRLAELYEEFDGDRASAMVILNQVVAQFPGTRHAANANHKLHELAAAAEEAQYLARQSGASGSSS